MYWRTEHGHCYHSTPHWAAMFPCGTDKLSPCKRCFGTAEARPETATLQSLICEKFENNETKTFECQLTPEELDTWQQAIAVGGQSITRVELMELARLLYESSQYRDELEHAPNPLSFEQEIIQHRIREKHAWLREVWRSSQSPEDSLTDSLTKHSSKETAQQAEKRVLSLFQANSDDTDDIEFEHEGHHHHVELACKPAIDRSIQAGGEPKTDFFVKTADETGTPHTYPITFKLSTADFIENHISQERLHEILGDGAHGYSALLRDYFQAKYVHLIKQLDKAFQKGKLTLGYQVMIRTKKPVRKASQTYAVPLTREQTRAAYTGCSVTGNDNPKIADAVIDGKRESQAGIARWYCEEQVDSKFTAAQQVMDSLEIIDDDFIENHNAYFSCTACNYAYDKDKSKFSWENNRPLYLWIEYRWEGEQLVAYLHGEESQFYAKDTPSAMQELQKVLAQKGYILSEMTVDDIKALGVRCRLSPKPS